MFWSQKLNFKCNHANPLKCFALKVPNIFCLFQFISSCKSFCFLSDTNILNFFLNGLIMFFILFTLDVLIMFGWTDLIFSIQYLFVSGCNLLLQNIWTFFKMHDYWPITVGSLINII
jgi:hypothetical protein